MSVRLAAGCARSRSQSVSVVPMIQWLPHGMMNSRLFSVRVMTPVALLIRFRGTTRWPPFDARTWSRPRPAAAPRQRPRLGAGDDAGGAVEPVPGDDEVAPLRRADLELAAPADHLLDLVGPDPGGVDHVPRPDGGLPPALRVADPDPGDPVGGPDELRDPGAGDAQCAVGRRGPGQHHRDRV